jgi:hypothetical protein
MAIVYLVISGVTEINPSKILVVVPPVSTVSTSNRYRPALIFDVLLDERDIKIAPLAASIIVHTILAVALAE